MIYFLFSDVVELTPLQAFYKDKSVFLTGGTGFLGKGKLLVLVSER
jgi:FlaA1/EpsC-like NDP-sugar epimerase